MARGKPKAFNQAKGVRKLARERVGQVPPARPIDDKPERKKPKHKKPIDLDADS